MREGLIRHNPTQGAALPARDEHRRIDSGRDELSDDQGVRALGTEQLAALLLVLSAVATSAASQQSLSLVERHKERHGRRRARDAVKTGTPHESTPLD